jgi:MFS family permease
METAPARPQDQDATWAPGDDAIPPSGAGASGAPRFGWFNRCGVFSATSLIYAFLNLSTFNSLGVVLFMIVKDLHWSMAAAGFNFSLLGISCGLASPLAAWAMRRVGSGLCIGLGAVLLVLGFLLASASTGLMPFYAAMVLLGLGYAFAGVVPSIYLINGWFGPRAARYIGVYYMLGALGAAIGPPLTEMTIAIGGGWRGHWRIMAISAGVIGAICLALIRDAAPAKAAAPRDDGGAAPQAKPEWTVRQAVLTRQFLLVTLSQTLTMASVTTNSSIVIVHLVQHGSTPTVAALVLSVIALTATLIKGGAGRLCEVVKPSSVLAAGLVLQGVGNVLLLVAGGPVLPYVAGLVLGVGWALAYVAGTVVMLRYFGGQTGSQILSIVWFLVTVAAAGPFLAGVLADRYHSFAAIFLVYAAIFLANAVPIYLMRPPVTISDARTPA